MVKLNGRVVVDLEIDGIDSSDYPDFSDSFFSYGVFEDSGEELSNDELEKLTEENSSELNELAHAF